MVPPCFTAPLRAWPCVPGWTRPPRGNGRTRRGLGGVPLHPHSSEAIFHPVLTCPVPSFGLSVRRRRGVLSSSRLFAFCQRGTRPLVPIIIRKNSGFVNRGREQRNQKRWNSVNGKAQCLVTPFRGSLSHFLFGTIMQLPHTCQSDSCAVLCRRVSYSANCFTKIRLCACFLKLTDYLTAMKSASFSILSRFRLNEG